MLNPIKFLGIKSVPIVLLVQIFEMRGRKISIKRKINMIKMQRRTRREKIKEKRRRRIKTKNEPKKIENLEEKMIMRVKVLMTA